MNCTVHIVTEEYTSKGCGRCGKIHEKLGGQKWFTCSYESCGFSVPRDLNGAITTLYQPLIGEEGAQATYQPTTIGAQFWEQTSSYLKHVSIKS